jgi:hypothetical protein
MEHCDSQDRNIWFYDERDESNHAFIPDFLNHRLKDQRGEKYKILEWEKKDKCGR